MIVRSRNAYHHALVQRRALCTLCLLFARLPRDWILMSHTETEGYQLPLGSDRDLPLGRIDFQQPYWRPEVKGAPTLSERMRQLTPLDFTWPAPLVTKVKLLHPKAKVPTRSHWVGMYMRSKTSAWFHKLRPWSRPGSPSSRRRASGTLSLIHI